MKMPTLETQRLQIRPFEEGDLARCHALLDEVYTPETLAQRRDWLQWTIQNYTQLARLYQPPYGDRAILERASGAVIGACGLVPLLAPFAQLTSQGERPPKKERFTPEVGLYYLIEPQKRGRGFAAEAAGALVRWSFQALSLSRVVAGTTYQNHASIRVMEKLGMTLFQNPLPEPEWLQVVGILSAKDQD